MLTVEDNKPTKVRLAEVGKRWVKDFIDFYGLKGKITKRQAEGWNFALARFSDEILKEGWDDFIMQFRPGFIPPIEDANRIFRRANHRVVDRKEAEERKRRTIEERNLFQSATGEKKRIAQAIIHALDMIQIGATTKKNVNLYMADFWEKAMNDKEMGRKHRMLADGKRVVIHDPNQYPK